MYQELDQPQKAVYYFNRCLQITQKQFHLSKIILLSNTIGFIIENFDKVATTPAIRAQQITQIQKSLAHLREIIDQRPTAGKDFDCQVAEGRCMINYYGKLLNKHDRAQPYADRLQAMLSDNLGQEYKMYIYNVLIPFYISSKQYDKARVLLAKNEQICQQALDVKELSINHLWWFKLDSAQTDLTSAIRHFQRYKILNDSLLNEKTRQRTSLMEVQYQTQEKEHRIVQLRQESQLRESELQKTKATRNFIVAGAVMLALLLGLFYNRYRLKQRTNQQLQAKQVEVEDKNRLLEAKQLLLEAKQLEVEDKNQLLQGLLSQKEELVEQKEWLLKEVHHRVKNNLQIIISLLQSQGRYLSDEVAINAINQSKHRVRAMALIHQKLYRSDTLSTLDASEYLKEVVGQLAESFDAGERIRFDYQLESLELDVVQAVPLGLILNEAVTNTIKYAFPNGRAGTVRLCLRHLEGQHYELVVEDDGVGLPAGLALERSHSMGAKIMRGLSKQLEGSLKVESQGGVKVTVRFLVSPVLLPDKFHSTGQFNSLQQVEKAEEVGTPPHTS
jgi:two-component sensor histidine kinase